MRTYQRESVSFGSCLSSVDRSTCVHAFTAITHAAVIFSTGGTGQCGLHHVHLLERHNNHLVTPLPQDTHMTDYEYLNLMSSGAERMVVAVMGVNKIKRKMRDRGLKFTVALCCFVTQGFHNWDSKLSRSLILSD